MRAPRLPRPSPPALLGLALAASVLLAACGDDGGAPVDAGEPPDAFRPDAGPPDAGPPPDDTPWKGPWVIRPDVDRVTVRWESRLPPDRAAVEYEREAGGGLMMTALGATTASEVMLDYQSLLVEEPDLAGTYYLNEVEITGLDPATCYRYALPDFPGYGGRFCTMHLADDHTTPIQIYVIGDTNPSLTHTADILSNTDPAESEWVLHAGDIQYYESIVETWQSWFGDMRPMLEAGAFLPCVGNHEFELEHEFEDYYVRLFGGAGQDGDEIRYHFQTGGVHFFSLSTEHDLAAGSEQVTWFLTRLEEVEADPNYRFTILFLHRPYYTVGESNPRLEDRAVLEPIVTSHRVPLVIAGHEHGYERFEVDAVTYVTSGGGGASLSNIDERVDEFPEDAALRVVSGAFYQALVLTIEGMDLRGEVYDDLGMIRDSFEKTVAP